MKRMICALSLLVFMATGSPAVMAQTMPEGKLFDLADTNKDGAISEAEWHAAMQKRFEAMDKNKDGKISKEEWQEMKDNMKGQLRSRLRNRM